MVSESGGNRIFFFDVTIGILFFLFVCFFLFFVALVFFCVGQGQNARVSVVNNGGEFFGQRRHGRGWDFGSVDVRRCIRIRAGFNRRWLLWRWLLLPWLLRLWPWPWRRWATLR
jgi:hypothetical protein